MSEPEEQSEFNSARRVEPSEVIGSFPALMIAWAVPGSIAVMVIGMITLLNGNNDNLTVAGAIVFGAGVIADAIRRPK